MAKNITQLHSLNIIIIAAAATAIYIAAVSGIRRVIWVAGSFDEDAGPAAFELDCFDLLDGLADIQYEAVLAAHGDGAAVAVATAAAAVSAASAATAIAAVGSNTAAADTAVNNVSATAAAISHSLFHQHNKIQQSALYS